MGFTAAQLALAGGGVGVAEAERYLRQWGGRYTDVFTVEQAARHRAVLAALTPTQPVEVLVESGADGLVACTVLAFDYPALFSLISGLLGAAGLNILAGDIFTSVPPAAAAPRPARRIPRAEMKAARRHIIDHFRCRCEGADTAGGWAELLRARLLEVVQLLETRRPEEAVRARHLVYEQVARRMATISTRGEAMLYPVEFDVVNDGPFTRLLVRSQDTPFFLYALANALALRGITIERVTISTTDTGQVADCIEVLDARGLRIEDPRHLDELRFSVALTKQFTYCLGTAHDPYAALTRFERLTEEIAHNPERGRWLDQFARPASLQDLARILGASDFLWEDFIRAQYETLLPLLQERAAQTPLDVSMVGLRLRLEQAMREQTSDADRRVALNAWKDREIFQIDLHHILADDPDVRRLAEPLTRVAELVVGMAVAIVDRHLAARYGTPRTVGGLPTACAICGLGKLGGVALGYASDIELLFVYADNGSTDGPESITNAEYFDRLVQETSAFVIAKREGVFQIDLRLRPYGTAGPLACSLDNFCRYYGPGGAALSFERLALVRLRAIAGDPDLGERIERLRDQFVYESASISVPELQELRDRQVSEKAAGTRPNAKLSPGALVDIEYCVQMLQIQHGGVHSDLRTPRIHEALEALSRAGLLDVEESRRLTRAYYFLRRLINALRMLRGNALDLFLPDPGTLEYRHLARRMGYRGRHELDVGRQLFADFETETAVVRRFVQEHFGRPAIAGTGQGNVVDLLLNDTVPPQQAARVLGRMGLRDLQRALTNLHLLAGPCPAGEDFLRLAVLAGDVLHLTADPDMALNNWQRFVEQLADPALHYAGLLLQPRRLDILLGVFATSQFLADTLVRDPEVMEWATDPEVLNRDHGVPALGVDLQRDLAAAGPRHEDCLNAVRRFRRRHILRIGIRDIFLKLPVRRITAELADLAETILDWSSAAACRRLSETMPESPPSDGFCILAFGKCGGRELNYSSDLDLVGVYRERAPAADDDRRFYEKVLEAVRADLMGHTDEGFVYRVDFRLRPYGRAGGLAVSSRAAIRYYGSDAALWELQALLKARPVAGNRELGRDLLDHLRPFVAGPHDLRQLTTSVRRLRAKAVHTHGRPGVIDIKTGPGGIRDAEFLVQALQLAHAQRLPGLLLPGTLEAIDALVETAILSRSEGDDLRDSYTFLRRVEHFLQLLEDRQTHSLPETPAQQDALARRVLGPGRNGADLLAAVCQVTERTAALFDAGLRRLDTDAQPSDSEFRLR
jgi:glutamate-ammonia-ligase adenylyltransferase